MEEGKIYKPEELLFVVLEAPSDSPDSSGFPVVCFTTKKCWDENKHQSDDLGEYNTPGKILNSCGVWDGELTESVFEIMEGNTTAEVKEKLLAAGFGEDPEFTEFITKKK